NPIISTGGNMVPRFFYHLTGIMCLLLALGAAPGAIGSAKNKDDAASQSIKAATVFKEIMATPDKAVPVSVLDKAFCVAVFPKVFKAGFIFGGRGGRGVASCRTDSGWSAPAYFYLAGGSFGLQIGAQATDFVLLFMNEEGLKSLLKSKFEMGGDASV